jgi:hypothetical protein
MSNTVVFHNVVWGSCYSIFGFMCMFCISLFVLFRWPLCCLFFDIWIMITPLVSSSSSYKMLNTVVDDISQALFKLYSKMSISVISGVRITRSLVLCVCLVDRCLYFFFWSLCCLFFDIRILITSLVSSNSSYTKCVASR